MHETCLETRAACASLEQRPRRHLIQVKSKSRATFVEDRRINRRRNPRPLLSNECWRSLHPVLLFVVPSKDQKEGEGHSDWTCFHVVWTPNLQLLQRICSNTSNTRVQWRTQWCGRFWGGALHPQRWFEKGSPSWRCFLENPFQLRAASTSSTAVLKKQEKKPNNCKSGVKICHFLSYNLHKYHIKTFNLFLWSSFISPLKNRITFLCTFW